MTAHPKRSRRWLARIARGVFISVLALLFLELLVVFFSLPSLPTTRRGWLLLLGLGPPSYLALEWLGERLVDREARPRISAAPFSWEPILFLLAVFLVLLVPLVWWSLAHAP